MNVVDLVIYYHFFQHLYQFPSYSCKSSWIFLHCFCWCDFYWFCLPWKSCGLLRVIENVFLKKLVLADLLLLIELWIFSFTHAEGWLLWKLYFFQNLWYCHTERASRCQCRCSAMSPCCMWNLYFSLKMLQ